MSKTIVGRRDFIAGVGIGTATATLNAVIPVQPAEAQVPSSIAAAQEPAAGYIYLKPAEAAFVEALVDHMIPKDELTGSGTEIGIATYIDRALAGSWGKGDRLYMQGPWAKGTANQGYQLPLTPAELYRAARRGLQRLLPQDLRQGLRPLLGRSRRKRSSRISRAARSRLTADCRAAHSSRCSTRT